MEKLKWTVQKRKVADLKNWEDNPRQITEAAFSKLKERITKRGFHDVVKIDIDNTIISGNQRKRALVELRVDEVDVIVPNRALTEEERAAVALESNRNDGEWDFEKLANHYDVEFLHEIGFTEGELGMAQMKQDIDEDEAPPLPETSKYAVGDLLALGEHRVICGDSTDPAVIEKLMGGELAHILCTDPPYNVNYDYSKYADGRKMKWDKVFNDNQSEADFTLFLTKVFENAARFTISNASFYVWHADRTVISFLVALQESGWYFSQRITWVKDRCREMGGSYGAESCETVIMA